MATTRICRTVRGPNVCAAQANPGSCILSLRHFCFGCIQPQASRCIEVCRCFDENFSCLWRSVEWTCEAVPKLSTNHRVGVDCERIQLGLEVSVGGQRRWSGWDASAIPCVNLVQRSCRFEFKYFSMKMGTQHPLSSSWCSFSYSWNSYYSLRRCGSCVSMLKTNYLKRVSGRRSYYDVSR
jgi:hypothetical protein